MWSVIATDAQAQTKSESQAAAVAAIEKLGWKIRFDEKSPGKPVVEVILDDSYLTGVASKVTNADLEHLEGLKNLEELAIQDTGVTDAGVKDLQNALPKCNIRK